jgi:hypothetical protein
VNSVITITGIGDHLQPEWLITFTGIRMLIRQHGDDAELTAARRADLMLERGDLEGQTVWKRITRVIVELQAPPTGPAH